MTQVARNPARPPDPASEAKAEASLIAAACGCDEDAFTQLYQRHAPPVFAYLTRLLGPIDEREDLLQQTFFELHRALPTFRGEAALSTFVHRIATHVAYHYLRWRRRRPAVPLVPEQVAMMVAPGTPPDEAVRARDDLRQLFELLDRLKPKKRLAFVLVAVEGLSLSEAALELGASEGAVKQRVLAARRDLVAMLARARRSHVEPI
jgi:RNA polymerase sigma-70 factor (ECF subfamily)